MRNGERNRKGEMKTGERNLLTEKEMSARRKTGRGKSKNRKT